MRESIEMNIISSILVLTNLQILHRISNEIFCGRIIDNLDDLTKILDKKHPKLKERSREETEENTERIERKE